ncbi:MAG: hypothetical protein L6Q83_01790 [Gammaproteobacteria bacterium]|nr:hypothetical protein [Gammaproteobacteria bacterium]
MKKIVVTGLSAALALVSASASAGLARGHLYSTAAVNAICGDAQQIVTSTSLDVNNVIQSEWNAFVQSDAAPYSVVGFFPPLSYTPEQAPNLPLTSQQHVIYGLYGTGNRDYPQVVSCKMKNAAYLNATIPGLGAVDQACSAVTQEIVDNVVASLTNPEVASVVVDGDKEDIIDDAVQFDADQVDTAGFAWTAGFPDHPYPVLYRTEVGGPLHVKASALIVEPHPAGAIFACNGIAGSLPPGVPLPSFCQPRKWGVRYCHLPAPEYVRAALTGEVEVPVLPTGP